MTEIKISTSDFTHTFETYQTWWKRNIGPHHKTHINKGIFEKLIE